MSAIPATVPDHPHGHGAPRRNTRLANGVIGVIFFLCTEVALFGSLIFAYLYLRRAQPTWPPPLSSGGVDHLEWAGLPLINTIVLLSSTVTCYYAEKAIAANKIRRFIGLLIVTIVLGAIFVGGQGYEYAHFHHMAWTKSILGATFFTITGLHGIHVSLGVIALLIILYHSLRGRFRADHYFPVLGVGLYWHFVDIIWVVIYAIFYIF